MTSMAKLFRTLLTGAVLQLAQLPAVGQQSSNDRVDKDYAAELPRIKPKSPAEALKSFQLQPGFQIEPVAGEPLIRDPVAMDFDEDGRLYVVEYPEYNQYASKNFKGRGAVRLLEDINGDGVFDKSTLFVENLDSPVAVACYDGGVFVGSVPNIYYCKDTNGDGKSDFVKPVFTGFARDAAGEGMLNSFRWGLDNRFHISTGLSGGDVRRADRPTARAVSVRNAGFIFDPRTLDFELTSGGGQHGMSMDDWGRTFVCTNSDPAHLIMYDSRYLARNPFLEAPPAAVNIAPQGKYTALRRISPVEPWRILRTRLRSKGLIPGSDEGGQPSGFFTGATGITVYRGDAWPDEYRGNLFIGEVSGNLVYRARVEPDGLGLKAVRAEAEGEFLASRDNWFRPVQFAHGPDGNLYVIDMYRELIEGAAFIATVILKHLDAGSGSTMGRIYRIRQGADKPRQPRRLSRSSTSELVALLEHPNGWHRDTAARLLYQRQDSSAIQGLRALAVASKTAIGRLHALYALAGLKALRGEDVVRGMQDPDPKLRCHALRLAERFTDEKAVEKVLLALVDDADVHVRYQLAFTLGYLQTTGQLPAILRLLERDGADSWFRLAILSSIVGQGHLVFDQLVRKADFVKSQPGRQFLAALTRQIGAARRPEAVRAALASIAFLAKTNEPGATECLINLLNTASTSEIDQFVPNAAPAAARLLEATIDRACRVAQHDSGDGPARLEAIRQLRMAPWKRTGPILSSLLNARQAQAVQLAAIEVMALEESGSVPAVLVEAWPRLSPKIRLSALEVLLSRSNWLDEFFKAIEQGKIRAADIDPARAALLQSSGDARVRERARKLFAGLTLARRDEIVQKYQAALKIKGDKLAGKEVFKKHCATCHRLEGVGENIGAELSAIRDRGLDAVLLNILDPNREVKPQFVNYVVETTQGRVVTGMITAETANSITIRRADAVSETILRSRIEEIRSANVSYMPEGLENQISVSAMADLLAYLNSIK